MPRACPEPSRRGGRRPGAGAPHGNLNALKHGRHSAYVQTLIHALAAHPATREALVRLARRQRAHKREAERTAALILSRLLDRALLSLKPVLSNAEGPVLNQVEGPVLSNAEGNNLSEDQATDTDSVLNAILHGNDQTPDTPRENQSDTGRRDRAE
jgi:hypothetical protein